jgi:hypothetical protein
MVAINANKAMVGSGGDRVWWESGVRESVLCWCIWQESDFSYCKNVFTFIHFIKKFYKFCTFNTICKDDAAINCITVQHKKKRFIPVKFDRSYPRLVFV